MTGVWDTLQSVGKLVGKEAHCSAGRNARHAQQLACTLLGHIMFYVSPDSVRGLCSRDFRSATSSKDEWQRRSALLAFGAIQASCGLGICGFAWCLGDDD